MRNTFRTVCTIALHHKTKTNTNPDLNQYRRRCPDPNARIQKFIHYMATPQWVVLQNSIQIELQNYKTSQFMKKVEQIVLLYDRSNFVQGPQKIRRSAFYPSIHRFCPQILSAVYRFNDLQIRKSAFYQRPPKTRRDSENHPPVPSVSDRLYYILLYHTILHFVFGHNNTFHLLHFMFLMQYTVAG